MENLGLLATPFGEGLRALALTCDDLRSLWSRSNLHASQGKFFTVWPPDPSQRVSDEFSDVNLLLATEIQDMSALKCFFFATCVYLRENLRVRLATQRKSPRKFNLRPLATSFSQGLKVCISLRDRP